MGWLNILNQKGVGSVMVFPLATALPEGRWYWEVRFVNGDAGASIGETARIGVFDAVKGPNGELGKAPESWAWRADGAKLNSGVSKPCGTGPRQKDDTVMVALDTAKRSVWFGLNGTWFEGDPASGLSPSFAGLPGLLMPALSSTHGPRGTLHQFVPTDSSDFRWQPPKGFQRFTPGTSEFLPRPIMFPAKPTFSVASVARNLLDTVVGLAGTRQSSLDAGRAARGTLYRELAKDFFAKGNLLIAEKLATQTLACDPSDSEAREMTEWFPITRGSTYGSAEAAAPTTDRLFDFVYIPTEKCGSGAHVMLLAVHPETTVPTTAEIQGALSLNAEHDLLARYRVLVFRRRPDLKAGLVMDARISGARQQPSGIVTGPEFAERLARIVRPDGFFQAVRHPFHIVRSTYNSNVIHYLCGDYSFSFANPETLFSDTPRDIDSIRSRVSAREGSAPPVPKIDRDRLKDHLDFAIRMPRPYSIGKVHADFFDAWQIIDLDRAARRNGRRRMAESYRALGVREDFEHPLDRVPHRDTLHFAMLRNGMRVRIFDAELTVYLGRALQTICYNTEDLIELCWAEPDPAWREVGLGETLCMATPIHKWRALPEKTKRRIAQSPKLTRFFRDVFIPCWIDDYRRWREALRPYLIDEIDDSLRKRMLPGVRDEAEAFLRVHPAVAESWPELVAML